MKIIMLLSLFLFGCSTLPPETAYRDEFGGYKGYERPVGTETAPTHEAIDRAYMRGELSAEEARQAHIQLSVKGHLTSEQMTVIYRDEQLREENYKRKTEGLRILRDTVQTNTNAAYQIITTIQSAKGMLR